MTASRTTPTLWVLVSKIGEESRPDSSIHAVPVISPFPFREKYPAKSGAERRDPRAKIAVTPVRTGPRPTTSFPLPRTMVTCPTVTPATSVIALLGPVDPSKEIPRSRARGLYRPGSDFMGTGLAQIASVHSLDFHGCATPTLCAMRSETI